MSDKALVNSVCVCWDLFWVFVVENGLKERIHHQRGKKPFALPSLCPSPSSTPSWHQARDLSKEYRCHRSQHFIPIPGPGREDSALRVGCRSAPRRGEAETIKTRAIKHPQQCIVLEGSLHDSIMSAVYGPCMAFFFFFSFD